MSEFSQPVAPGPTACRSVIWRMTSLLLLCIVSWWCAAPASTAQPPVAVAEPNPIASPYPHLAVDLSASPSAVAVGDPLTVTLTYRWPHGWTVQTPSHEPDPSIAFASEFVTSLPPVQATSTGEEQRRTFTLTLLALHSGTWQLPRPRLEVEGPDGHHSALANAVIIQVGTESKPANLPAARAPWMPPPAPLSHPAAWWLVPLSAVLLVLALALAYWWRRRHLLPPPTPMEVFTNDCLAAISTSDGKEAGALLSLALRRYVGALYAFDGPGSTTRETATYLRGRLSDDEQHALLRLLEQLDSLRWCASALPAPLVRQSAETARTWCDQVQRRLDEAALERARPHSAPTAGTRIAKEQP